MLFLISMLEPTLLSLYTEHKNLIYFFNYHGKAMIKSLVQKFFLFFAIFMFFIDIVGIALFEKPVLQVLLTFYLLTIARHSTAFLTTILLFFFLCLESFLNMKVLDYPFLCSTYNYFSFHAQKKNRCHSCIVLWVNSTLLMDKMYVYRTLHASCYYWHAFYCGNDMD